MKYKIIISPKGLTTTKRSYMAEKHINESLDAVISFKSRHFQMASLTTDGERYIWTISVHGANDSLDAIQAWGVMLNDSLYNQLGLNVHVYTIVDEIVDREFELEGWY